MTADDTEEARRMKAVRLIALRACGNSEERLKEECDRILSDEPESLDG